MASNLVRLMVVGLNSSDSVVHAVRPGRPPQVRKYTKNKKIVATGFVNPYKAAPSIARPYLRPIWGYFLTGSILFTFLVQTKYVSTAAIYSS